VSAQRFDVAVVGGGIVGCATALALSRRARCKLVLVEAEERLAAHQTGNNSGVVHSGLYYKPGSLKAQLCVRGRQELERFCDEQGVPRERCGKLVVATAQEQLPALQELERRGRANGLQGLERLSPEAMREHEPHVRGVAGLRVPETGIVDYGAVTRAYARLMQQAGAELRLGARLRAVVRDGDGLALETGAGPLRCRYLVNCAGLQCDRVARLCGVDPGLQIVPFRGEYYDLKPDKAHLFNDLIYPVPDPRFPFLGVHFTRMIGGGREAGPNAVLAFKREGYSRFSFSPRDTLAFTFYGGFWRMALKYWRAGMGEFYRSFSKGAFVRAMQGLIPEVQAADVLRGGAGVRAQALEPNGQLCDDFRIVEAARSFHVLNAPSPAATASLAIGRQLAQRVMGSFDLPVRGS